jgi:uncharacterized SAM-binding protein YcdF (DUF218 family)
MSSSILLYLFATPAVATFLTDELVMSVPPNPDLAGAQAIVVLGGDYKVGDGVRIPDSVGLLTLERLAAAARVYRRLRLPVAVTAGPLAGSHAPLAKLMRDELEEDFSVPTKWVEDRSRTTYENALYTAELLKPANISTVIVVTQGWHMPRALWSFDRVGLHALPFFPPEAIRSIDLQDFLPSARALYQSFNMLHEIMGFAYYRMFY